MAAVHCVPLCCYTVWLLGSAMLLVRGAEAVRFVRNLAAIWREGITWARLGHGPYPIGAIMAVRSPTIPPYAPAMPYPVLGARRLLCTYAPPVLTVTLLR
eukprot:1066550-Rhodomonas_salina.1